MKKLSAVLFILFITTVVWSQTSQKMNYQAVVRNSKNELIADTRIGMKISILEDSPEGIVVYAETQNPTTDENGVVSIGIGGEAVFDSIDWSKGPYFIKTETDVTGGTSYTITGTSQLLSVPYALHARTTTNLSGSVSENDPVFSGSVADQITKSHTEYWKNKQNKLIAGKGIRITDNVISVDTTRAVDEIGEGIASHYPGDEGIKEHPSVVFTENFEAASMEELLENWTWSSGADDHRLSLDTIAGPDGSPGSQSLKMTILRDQGGSGSDLRKILEQGHEQLFLRFYVKFAEDYGFNHHFTSLSGDLNPTAWSKGRAGELPVEHFSSTIDQITGNVNLTGPATTPPGYWCFYSYWPEMHSWQTLHGAPDGRPNPYYGNIFMPQNPVPVERGEWHCMEIMIRLNTAPDTADGAHAFWIDGELIGHWDPKEENPVEGYWIRDKWRHNPDHEDAEPFPGFKWRTLEDPKDFQSLKINIIRLQNYVSGTSWENADKYKQEHPDFTISRQEATVWKDNVVVATEYIGPVKPKE